MIFAGELLHKLKGHKEAMDLYHVEDGPYLLTQSNTKDSNENVFKVWRIDTWECIASYHLDCEVSNSYGQIATIKLYLVAKGPGGSVS